MEEVWNEGRPALQVRYLDSGNETILDEINSTDEFGRPIKYVPVDNESLREGAVIIPESTVGYKATFDDLWKKEDELLELGYDSGEEKDYVRLLTRVVSSSWWLDREVLAAVAEPTNRKKIESVAGMGRFAPIIPIRGVSGGGKGRLSNLLRFCSYHPVLMMRTYRLPSMYRTLHAWKGVLFIDEGDISEGNSEIGTYLLERSYGIPIIRVDPENITISRAFDNFGMTVLTQRVDFGENALEGRSLPFVTEKTEKQLPTLETPDMIKLGKEIQRDLLSIRMQYWDKIKVDPSFWYPDVTDARLNAAMLPLHAVSKLEVPGSLEPGDLAKKHLKRIEERKVVLKAESDDGVLINYLHEKVEAGLFRDHTTEISYFLERIERDQRGDEVEVPLTTSGMKEDLQWDTANRIRKKLRSLLKVDAKLKIGGSRVIPFNKRVLVKLFREFVPGFDLNRLESFRTDRALLTLSQWGGSSENRVDLPMMGMPKVP
jgi:hypothetical protein